jgi:geranylgeranyl pyrophosphate synthase
MCAAPLPKSLSALSPDVLDTVRGMILDSLRETSLAPVIDELSYAVGGGKMLRARLTLSIGSACDTPRDVLLRAAAAVEMVHVASLLHDDVIDGGHLRRGAPALWTTKGTSGAILLGDLLVCKSLQILDGTSNGCLGDMLVQLAGEMCDAEAEQELVATSSTRNWEKCVSMARRKTGSLFAFAASAADLSDDIRSKALLEAGYRIGTAYQLADDIMDACGTAVRDGKELGKDAKKGKPTSLSASGGSDVPVRQCIRELCESSSTLLTAWPAVQSAWNEYLHDDFDPVLKMFTEK